MSKTASLAHQIIELFDSNLAIGSSRHTAKARMRSEGRNSRGMGDRIHSWGTYRAEAKAAITVAKAIKAAYGQAVKYLSDWTPEIIRQVFDEFRAQGIAQNTLVTRQTALRRLEKLALEAGIIQAGFMPSGSVGRRQFSPRGAYTADEVRVIIDEVGRRDSLAGQVLALQFSAGLRLREAITIRSDTILDCQAGFDRPGIDIAKNQVFVEGKGGRQRVASLLDPAALVGLDLSRRFPMRTEQTEQVQMRAIQRQVRRACLRLGIAPHGTHGLRSAAARSFLDRQYAAGIDHQNAIQALAYWLGHNRTDVLQHYLRDS